MQNKMAYGFTSRHFLDLLEAFSSPNTLTAQFNIAEVILFALLNQKLAYNWKHQLLFIKVDE